MTTALGTELPEALRSALNEMERRLDEAAATGRTQSAEPASIVVINDAPTGLKDPTILDAVSRLARLARKANMGVELRGHPLVPLIEHLGSMELRSMALDPGTPHVYYRCLRPMHGVPHDAPEPGVTRVVHADPRVLERGGIDTGTFVGWLPGDPGHRWARVAFSEGTEPATVLVEDLLVEVTPA